MINFNNLNNLLDDIDNNSNKEVMISVFDNMKEEDESIIKISSIENKKMILNKSKIQEVEELLKDFD